MPATEPQHSAPLHILLTSDDGWRGAGGADTPLIVALRAELQKAGHEVTVVAPATDQSGKGTSLSTGKLTVTQVEPDVILADDPPDVVVSGPNPGGNHTIVTNGSGTMGAATRAAERGVPAVAVSIDSLVSARSLLFADEASAYTVELLDGLTDSFGDDVLPSGVALNVNYPARVDAAGAELPARGVRLSTVDPSPYIEFAYAPSPTEPGVFVPAITPADGPPTPGSDWDALSRGFVSITPLDPDPTAGSTTADEVAFLACVGADC